MNKKEEERIEGTKISLPSVEDWLRTQDERSAHQWFLVNDDSGKTVFHWDHNLSCPVFVNFECEEEFASAVWLYLKRMGTPEYASLREAEEHFRERT